MLVRHEFSDETVWRNALGNSARLYPFALHGFAIDAPMNLPAGSTKSYLTGKETYSMTTTFYRY